MSYDYESDYYACDTVTVNFEIPTELDLARINECLGPLFSRGYEIHIQAEVVDSYNQIRVCGIPAQGPRSARTALMGLRVLSLHAVPIAARSSELENIAAHIAAESAAANVEPRIVMPPLHRLCSLARWLSSAAYETYVYPHIADIHREYFEAIKAGDERKAKWIVFMGHVRVLRPLIAALWTSVAAWWKLSGN